MDTLADLCRTLSGLARSGRTEDRERLLTAVTELCDGSPACRRPLAQAVLSEVLLALIAEAEHDIRARLAERLAGVDWAPRRVISLLSLDDIDIARPIIARSPVLGDPDLVRLLTLGTLEHQIEVARRPAIGPAVVDAILDRDRPEVLSALAGNETAEIEPSAMERLVAASRHAVGVRAPLSRHPRLGPEAAAALYAWVGETLRETLAARFDMDAGALHSATVSAVADAHRGATRAGLAPPGSDQAEMERRLVAKLDAAGELRPGYLLRALREGKLGLFEAALVALSGFAPALVTSALDADRPEPLALACVAVGVDRSAFSTVLALVRGLNAGRPLGEAASGSALQVALAGHTPQSARAAFLSARPEAA